MVTERRGEGEEADGPFRVDERKNERWPKGSLREGSILSVLSADTTREKENEIVRSRLPNTLGRGSVTHSYM